MLLTIETTSRGEDRIYATQQASVVTYFAEDSDGGTVLHVQAGEFACRWSTTQAKLDAVRDCVLAEVASRLSCPTEKVLCRSLAEIALVADPLTDRRYDWSSRRHSRHDAVKRVGR